MACDAHAARASLSGRLANGLKSINLNIPATAAERVAKADAAKRAKTANDAGPELLAALKAIVEGGGLHLNSNVSTEDLLRAHAAIAKAEGVAT